MTETKHEKRCDNGCIRRMDIEKIGAGDFSYYQGTLDCPAQISVSECFFEEEVAAISLCGCCSFEDGSLVKKPGDCRFQKGEGNFAECSCHNTRIIYAACLSKRNHGACPYGLVLTKEEREQ
jgi:hypothetical protein